MLNLPIVLLHEYRRSFLMKKVGIILTTIFLILLYNVLYAENRTLDGYGNNIEHPTWGINSMPFFNFLSQNVSTYSRMDYSILGISDNAYTDGFSTPARPELYGNANVRFISNLLSSLDKPIELKD